MKRFIGIIGLCAWAAMFFNTPSSAYRRPEGPATLSAANIVYHIRDDDKDQDSYESVTINCGQYRAGFLQSAGAGQTWKDQSETAPLYFGNIDRNIEPSDCDELRVSMTHSTRGNDNFKFAFTIVLEFTDGSSRVYDQGGTITLTKDSGTGSWNLRAQ
jgi:hypothetical protein